MSSKFKSNHKKNKRENAKDIYKEFETIKKQQKLERKRSLMEEISETLSLPSDVLANAPLLLITGKNQISIENYKSIIEYNGNIIKIQSKACRIVIEGKHLSICYFSKDEMRITGLIQAIHYQ